MKELLKNSVSGLLVEPQAVHDFGKSILTLAQNPGLRATIGQAARQKMLRQFGRDQFVQKMTRVYLGLLQGDIPVGEKRL